MEEKNGASMDNVLTDLELLRKNILAKIVKHNYRDEYNDGFRDGLYEAMRLINKVEAFRSEVHYGDANDEQ